MQEIDIVILGAGASSRMRGADKLLACVDGVAQLRRVALTALMTGQRVIVVLAAQSAARHTAVQDLPVTVVAVAPDPLAMSASLRAGAAVCHAGRAVMILPADMPDLDARDLWALVQAHRATPQAILRGADAGQAGHPVVIPVDLVPALQDLVGDRGARDLIAAHLARLQLVDLPPGHATKDLDTPEDWAAWHASRAAAGVAVGAASEHPSMRDALDAAAQDPEHAVLAVITGVVGASYRKPGAMMALFADGRTAGSLTNGCIEGDLALHAAQALQTGSPRHLRYGAGSDYFDIRLPCGGGLQIALFPKPAAAVLAMVQRRRAARAFFALRLDPAGGLHLQDPANTGWQGDDFVIDARPAVQFAIFGDGPEAVVFTRLVQSSGFAHRLVTTSPETFEAVQSHGVQAEYQPRLALPDPAGFDARTAVVTFFHDHDQELGILRTALNSAAFYIGAQGSRRVAEGQKGRLQAMGVTEAAMARFHSPIGLIASARDPRTLAVSVLAEVLQRAAQGG